MIVTVGLRRGITLAAIMIGVGGALLVASLTDATFSTAHLSLVVVVTATVAAVLGLRLRLTGHTEHDLALVRRAAKFVPVALVLVAWSSLAVAMVGMNARLAR